MTKSNVFTAVFRDITGDEVGEITCHPKWSAGSWSHALEDRDAARALLADGGKGEAGDFVFPPMPPAVVVHDKVGPLFDRLSMHFYASKCMSLAAPREALTDERISEIIEEFDGGSWIDGEYRIECKDMMRLARAIEQAAKEKA